MLKSISRALLLIMVLSGFTLFLPSTFAYVFAFLACVTIGGGAWNVYAVSKRLHIMCKQPLTSTDGEARYVQILLTNNSLLPLMHAQITVSCTHRITGERTTASLMMSVGPKQTYTYEWPHTVTGLGKYDFCVEQVQCLDALHIFQKRVPVTCTSSFSILPNFHTQARPLLTQQVAAYSGVDGQRHGHELQEIQPYRLGDAVKHIHWKLSSKTDELYSKKMTEPIQSIAQVAVDFTASDGTIEQYSAVFQQLTAYCIDAVTTQQTIHIALYEGTWRVVPIQQLHDITTVLETLYEKTLEELSLSQQALQQLTETTVITTNIAQRFLPQAIVIEASVPRGGVA